MSTVRIAAIAVAVAVAIAAAPARATAHAAPLPRSAGQQTVTVVTRGVPTPTQFAVFAGRLFVAGYGDEANPDVVGGVYVLGRGKAIRVPGSPHHAYGLAAGKNALYLSTNHALLAWSAWNGTRFRKTRV